MAKINNISGFPEWLAEQKLIENDIIARVQDIYELHGFTPIETPAVELLSTLTSKGEITKEIYVLRRLHGEEDEVGGSSLALHFDLTIPFARYVAQHFNEIHFPFKRYQLQKVWRGERPQEGRFREFYQFDIDIISRDTLPLCHDAEVVTVVDKAFETIDIGPYVSRINNRKVLHGIYDALGLGEEMRAEIIGVVDKMNKIGEAGVAAELAKTLGISAAVIEKIIEYSRLRFTGPHAAAGLEKLGVQSKIFEEGAQELQEVLRLIPPIRLDRIEVDLSLARGLDYYTGLILETFLTDHPGFGSVCGGGRYDDLASRFIRQKLPGVGVSIGLTRLMSLIIGKELVKSERKSPVMALVTVYDEDSRAACNELAEILRARRISTEVFSTAPKLGKQIDYAAKKKIPFVIFPTDDPRKIEVKDLTAQSQQSWGIEEWCASLAARV